MRDLNRQLGTPSHWLPVDSCKEGQKGALAAVCTPTLKSVSKKHQKLCTSVSEHRVWYSEGGKMELCLVYIFSFWQRSFPSPLYVTSRLEQATREFLENLPKVRLPYTGAITMALKPPFSSLYHYPGFIGTWGLPTSSLPPWSFLPMGIGEPYCDCLALVIFDLGDALVGRRLHLGDALPWRRFLLVTLALGISSPRRRLMLTLSPDCDFDLDFVNAWIRDGT